MNRAIAISKVHISNSRRAAKSKKPRERDLEKKINTLAEKKIVNQSKEQAKQSKSSMSCFGYVFEYLFPCLP